MKIDKDNYKVVLDEFMDDVTVEDLADNLPDTTCRCASAPCPPPPPPHRRRNADIPLEEGGVPARLCRAQLRRPELQV